MGAEKVHRSVSADGTGIAARVHGDGPPVVFVNGGGGDGDSSWAPLLPFVSDRLTCFTMSTRGRGLSDDSDDHACERLVDDVTAMAGSVGEPVGLVGHSSGASLALAAAAQSDAVAAVAVYEPALGIVGQDADTSSQVQAAMERALEALSAGDPVDAARGFVEGAPFFNDDETALMSELGVFEFMADYVEMWLREVPEYIRAVDEAVIERIDVPVLLLHGDRTHRYFTSSVEHLVAHLADARSVEVSGVGHMGPVFAAGTVADELIGFFESTLVSD